jgi:hypothetical protein
MTRRSLAPCRSAGVLILTAAMLGACGGGPTVGDTQPTGAGTGIDVRVSAGAPVAGAMVTVYAVDEAGEQNTSAGERGVLARGGPTDADGRALVPVAVAGYTGPIQVVAAGSGLSYVDPTTPPPTDGSAPRVVQIPATFSLSSYVAEYRTGTPVVVPVTLLTTLADHAALAYARGRHPARPQSTTLRAALAARDELFVKHITLSPNAWSPTSLRATVPAALTKGPQTLVDTAYAAMTDVALNQLARDVALRAGYGTDAQNAVNAITLVQLLNQDVDADGRLDGRAEGGRAIAVTGTPAVGVDSHFLRKTLAQALDGWVRNRAVNKSGISTADLAAAQVYARLSTDTSDLFDDAAVEVFDPLDHLPPEISFTSSVSGTLYTNQSTIMLRLLAIDASGVKAVYCAAGTRTFAGTLDADGSWTIAVDGLAVGRNSVVLWAEDAAEPATNSGRGVAGRQLTLDVLYDPTPPTVTYDAEFACYADERGMTVAMDANGRAVVPATYQLARGKAPITRNGEIWKAATRLSGGALDVAELEGANAGNVPVLRFAIPFNADTESPIVAANYSVAVSCSGCAALPVATGATLVSPTAGGGVVRYDLPVATERIPALASVVGASTMAVTLEVTDAAGNRTTSGPYSFALHVIGPPLGVFEDTSYGTYGDLWSSHAYAVGLQYATLWNLSADRFGTRNVRLVRYVITNPAPQPIAFNVTWAPPASGNSWKLVENWRGFILYEPGSTYLDNFAVTPFVLDGFTFYQTTQWAYPHGTPGAGAANSEMAPWPCSETYEQGGMAAHRIGDWQNRFVCAPLEVRRQFYDSIADMNGAVKYVESAVFSESLIVPEFYAEYTPIGREMAVAPRLANGMVTVPAASAAGPGVAVVYLTRPGGAPRTRGLEVGRGSGAQRFETWPWEIWAFRYKWTLYSTYEYHTYRAWRLGTFLESAADVMNGQMSVTTQGLVANSAFGEAAVVSSAAFNSRVVATH